MKRLLMILTGLSLCFYSLFSFGLEKEEWNKIQQNIQTVQTSLQQQIQILNDALSKNVIQTQKNLEGLQLRIQTTQSQIDTSVSAQLDKLYQSMQKSIQELQQRIQQVSIEAHKEVVELQKMNVQSIRELQAQVQTALQNMVKSAPVSTSESKDKKNT